MTRIAASYIVKLCLVFSILVSAGCSFCAFDTRDEPLEGVVSDHIKGVSLGLFATDPFWDYGELIDEIAAHNATDLMIVVPIYQENISSSEPRLTLPPETLQRSFSQAREAGLRLTVMPIIKLDQRRGTDEWRGVLEPENEEIWWSNYRSIVMRLAIWSEAAGGERFYLGSELCSLEGESQQWDRVITSIRSRFSGSLSYSANWDHYEEVGFWSDLDELSVTAYFPVDHEPSDRWRLALTDMKELASALDRPLIISEYGYPAVDSAATSPWDETASSVPAPELQAELVGVALAEIERADIRGGFLWNWFGFGGDRSFGYSPRGREAAAVVKVAFGAAP